MKRVKFIPGKQREFLLKACRKRPLKQFWIESKLDVSYSVLRRYVAEELTLPLPFAEKIAKDSNQKLSDYPNELLDANWGAVKGGKIGIVSMHKQYAHKLSEWGKENWRNNHSHMDHTKNITYPILNEKLAEFIGIYLGDGTLTKYFVRIFGDKRYDSHYFDYISDLVEEIFDIKPSIREIKNKNLIILEVSSKKLCNYLQKEFNFKIGSKIRNKQKIPMDILNNQKLLFACLRGLIDTDGTVSKDGTTLCIRFTSHSPTIIKQLTKINEKINIFTFTNKTSLGTRNMSKIDSFFNLIGSSNLSNIIRYCEFKKGNLIYKEKVLKYHHLYKKLDFPYKGP